MNASRLMAVIFIFVCTLIAWMFLGGSLVQRTGQANQQLAQEVAQLWGGRHEQRPPEVWIERPTRRVETVQVKKEDGSTSTREVTHTLTERTPLPFESSRIDVAFELDPRRKGLLWYATWGAGYRARYRVRNPDDVARKVGIRIPFPSPEAIYDGFGLRVDGRDVGLDEGLDTHASAQVVFAPGADREIEVAYRTRGLGPWTYSFGPDGVSRVRDFELAMTTDFEDVDFPSGTLSPTTLSADGPGRRLTWAFESLVTGRKIGLDPPQRLNPGPFAARVTFFAPVGLLFFMTALVILGMVRGPSLHPMHWFFLSAAFFSFHLLLAYLVDHVNVHVAFALAAVTSVFLVVSYLRIVAGTRFALLRAGLAQVVFLVLFSYSFFLEGYTGLTLTIGAVVTLFVLMQSTARVDWATVFGQSGDPSDREAKSSQPQS
ncbi:MAG: inner membrane CreD family protein [Acidobacteria bacterium]|jgi:hypothetical protein|nr:inner membrane CreD family protein [Acidobacteriota bacterium]